MGKKKSKKIEEGETKQKGGEGEKKEEGPIPVVLKVDMHCDGCATKIMKYVRTSDGVETAKADYETNKLTVVGKVDPSKLRENLETKTKRKVELLSPLPKKDKDAGGGGDKKTGDKPEKKPDEKKPKEPPVTTAVLKINVHCEGCVQKIHRVISKTKGVQSKSIDRQKDLVTVKGTMDAKALAEALKERLKRPVEIVQPKKEKDGDEKKVKGGGGGEKKGDGDGGKKEEAGKAEGNRMDYFGYENMYGPGYIGPGYVGPGYAGPGYVGPGYAGPGYVGPGYAGPGYVGPGYMVQHLHAPQIFSDENPNACSVM